MRPTTAAPVLARVLGLVLGLVLAVTGCGAEEKLAETAAEEAVEQAMEGSGKGDVELDVDEDGNTVTYEGEDGTLTMGGGEIPDSFPDGIPLPPDEYSVVNTMEVTGEGGYVQLTLNTAGTVEELTDLMRQGLEDGGFAIEGTQEHTVNGETSVILSGAGQDKSVLVSVNDAAVEEGQVSVSYTITAAES